MKHGPDSLLWDVAESLKAIRTFIAGRTFDEYEGDLFFRSAIERQLTITGEALGRLARIAPDVAALSRTTAP